MKSSSVPPLLSFLQDLKLPRHALLSACGLRSGVQAFDVLGGAAGVGGFPGHWPGKPSRHCMRLWTVPEWARHATDGRPQLLEPSPPLALG